MRDFDKGYECLKALKALGVRISLDDFGSGYSSLSYVHRLPLDKIKIDRSFIKDIETRGSSRDIVKTIIDLCENLKLACIVEGVHARYAGGAMGGDRSGISAFSDQVLRLAEAAKAAAERL